MSLRLQLTLILFVITASFAVAQTTIIASPSEKKVTINNVMLDRNSTFDDVQSALGEPDRYAEEKKENQYIYDSLGVIVTIKKKRQLVQQILITYSEPRHEASPIRPFNGKLIIGDNVITKTDAIEEVNKKASVYFNSMAPFPYYFFEKDDYMMLILYGATTSEMKSIAMVFDTPKK